MVEKSVVSLKTGTPLKIPIYDSIIHNWDKLPTNFTLLDLSKYCETKERSIWSLQKQRQWMKNNGLIEHLEGTRKTWHKRYKHIDRWLNTHLNKVMRNVPDKMSESQPVPDIDILEGLSEFVKSSQ